MVFSIQQEILQIIGYCKLKNFIISTALSKIIYMLLNSIFHQPMIKHQLKKYNKFIVYFINKINTKQISINNKKRKYLILSDKVLIIVLL